MRIGITTWVLCQIFFSVIAANLKKEIFEHVRHLKKQISSGKHHQLNGIAGLETDSSASCDFNKSLCGYRMIQDIGSQNVRWSLLSKDINNTQHLPKGNYVALMGSGKEGMRCFLLSPNFQTKSNDRIEFYYYLSGDNPGQLQVIFIQNSTKMRHKLWSDLEDHGTGLNYGCTELPPNQAGHLMFIGILGSSTERIIAVQKVSISQGSCKHNGQMSTCTFDNSLLCNYTIDCRSVSKYTWRRHKGATPTLGTGPNGDVVEPFNGFYLYAESSYGSQGDSTSVNFPLSNSTGRYLHFWYHMYGKGIGSLHLRYRSGQSIREEWSVSGEQGDMWRYFCQQIVDDLDGFSLIAVRGSYLGDIAIDNVRVDDKNCQNSSLDCNFNTPFICGYNIRQWLRVKTVNGFKMNTTMPAREHSMISPTVDVLDSCVRIHYQMVGDSCNLIIYENQQKVFNLVSNKRSILASAQFYVKQARMNLKFEANTTNTCTISIEKVSVVKGNCPALECPKRMLSCLDGRFCVNKKQMCDLQNDCKDGSDEICPTSLACDFEYSNNCGYSGKKDSYERFEEPRNESDYQINVHGPDTNWTSPMQQINDSCIQFSFKGKSFARVELLLLRGKNDKSSQIWKSSFPEAETSWSVGQIFISAGSVQLVFNVKGQYGSLFVLDDIRLIKGSCPPLDCGKENVPCASNEQCVKKTDVCNRQNDCMDKSDEANCPYSIDCDFEHDDLCGYRFENGWIVTSGKENIVPRHDQSKGTFYGKYMMQRILNKRLFAPEITLSNMACVQFYYYLRDDNSTFRVYDNNVPRLQIKSNNIGIWQMSQLQLSAGKHALSFSQIKMIYLTTLAIDSVSTIPGRCPQMDCPDKWKTCASADICVPYFRFCDGEIDCPNGEDENNCTANSTLRLIDGNSVSQGYVEYRLNGTWNSICYENENKPSALSNANVLCRNLGYKLARTAFRTVFPKYVISRIKDINCAGNETSISECSMQYCTPSCYCKRIFSVDCSNNYCLSDQVQCPGTENLTPSDGEFRCIWKYNLCDGEYDCPGGTDEKNCIQKCHLSEFRCRNRKCIPKRQRCDGVSDCDDSSDEHGCFMQKETTIFMIQNNKFEALCENNINNQQIANELCKAVGRGDGTVLQSSKSGRGIEFMVSTKSKGGILSGYYPIGITSCKLLSLMCNLKRCGTRTFSSDFEPNIKYGIFTLPGEWPWQVVVLRNNMFTCGGTLISQRYVLTAAHCVRDNSYSYTVKVGSVNRRLGLWKSVKNVTVHTGFDLKYFRNDVALLELSSPVELNNFTQIACLPSKPVTMNSLCFATGWGQDEKGIYPKYLKETKVHILTSELCKSYYKNTDKVVICANHPEPHQPACFGDSGGPLSCLNEYGHWEVIGVTSYGKRKCLGEFHSPEAYADVYAHIDWIMKKAPNLYQ